MAFGTAFSNDIASVGSGERYGKANVELSSTVFEDGLIVGRFAKLDTGSIDLMDGSATPSIAGVVLRSVSMDLASGEAIDSDIYGQIDYVRSGLCTVAVKTGETPAALGRVYVSNGGDANDGKATATNTDVAVNAEFILEMKTDVWLIYLAPPPGDIADHIGDATGAHAASAISVLDTGAFTTAIQVEAALAELYPLVIWEVADPSDAGALPVTRSAVIAITTTGVVDTRTLAIPTILGQTMTISFDVDAGDAVITVASAINQTGNNTLTMDDIGEAISLIAVQIAGVLAWRVLFNDGVTLSTV